MMQNRLVEIMSRKYILRITFLLAFVFNYSQAINWISFEKAIEYQKSNPKNIIMDVYTNWCGPCKLMDKNTFQNKAIAQYINEHYYAVKFNAEGDEMINFNGQEFSNPNYNPALANRRNSAHELSRFFKIQAYPTIVFLDEKANLIFPLTGYKTPSQIELYLKMFKKDDHKILDTQEKFNEYFRAFKSEFKD